MIESLPPREILGSLGCDVRVFDSLVNRWVEGVTARSRMLKGFANLLA